MMADGLEQVRKEKNKMKTMYDNTKKSRLNNTTKENNYYEPTIKITRKEYKEHLRNEFALQHQLEEKDEYINIMSEAFDELKIQKQDYTQINILEMKLKEKQKIIDEAIKYLIKIGKQPDADLYYCISEHKEYTELLEILESGKNGI